MARVNSRNQIVITPRNVYTTLTTTTPVLLIDYLTVLDPNIGFSSSKLEIHTLNIANTAASNNAVIDLYLIKTEEGTFGSNTVGTTAYAMDNSVAVPDVITKYYIIKSVTIPVGTSLQIESNVFKDIDFQYYNLEIVGDANTSADIILNFKK
tara:strand:- start:137 stop:592 length:456 start_codon:yes stop_codon:yes gene_type:complete